MKMTKSWKTDGFFKTLKDFGNFLVKLLIVFWMIGMALAIVTEVTETFGSENTPTDIVTVAQTELSKFTEIEKKPPHWKGQINALDYKIMFTAETSAEAVQDFRKTLNELLTELTKTNQRLKIIWVLKPQLEQVLGTDKFVFKLHVGFVQTGQDC